MIDIRDGELFDLLRFSSFSDDVDAQCFSWALKRGLTFVLDRIIWVQTYSAIDEQPESTIDALAQDLDAPYYDQTLPLDVKRQLVKSAIAWHYHAGTPSAVRELINVVLGDGQVIEWFNFDDYKSNPLPYTFDIKTIAPLQPDTRAKLLNMLDGVKNVRSHLRTLRYERKPVQSLFIGHNAISIRRHYTDGGPMDTARYNSAHLTAISALSIPRRHTVSLHRETRTTGAACALSVQVIRRRIVH